MSVKTIFSKKKNIKEAVKDIKDDLENFNYTTLLYFADIVFNQDKVAKLMEEEFGGENKTVFGGSTYGEISTKKIFKEGITVMAFNDKTIQDIKIEVLTDVKKQEKVKIYNAFKNFEKYFEQKMLEMNIKDYFGLTLLGGTTKAEEDIMKAIGDLTDLIFVGGSTGDKLKFEESYVYANGKAYLHGNILALIKSNKNFDIIKTQSFDITDKKIRVTETKRDNRTITGLNNKPAVNEYARLLGYKNPKKIKIPEDVMENPFGLVINGEPFVRTIHNLSIDKQELYLASEILAGTEVNLLKIRSFIDETKEILENKNFLLNQVKNKIESLIVFNCGFRDIQLQKENKLNEYEKTFKVPTIGMQSLGEQYLGHNNQTAVMVAFGE